jgi:hypothetical protein
MKPSKEGFQCSAYGDTQVEKRIPWKYHFLPNHKAIFKGGYEYYNPAKWYFNPATAELKLIVPKMKQRDFKLFNQWIGLESLKKVNSKEKTIFYTLREGRICFMGYWYEKPGW